MLQLLRLHAFLPQKVVELRPDAETVDTLHSFPFIDPVLLATLKSELPHYIAQAADIDADFDPLEWWRAHQTDLPHWSAAASDILLAQPSSAAAKRVFTFKSNVWISTGHHSNDYIQTSLMLQYNDR